MSLIQLSKLTFSYESSDETIFEQVSIQIDTNWKLGLIGRNGKGKTTLCKLLMGEYAYQGSISAKTSFSYFPDEIEDQSQQTLNIIKAMIPELELWQLERELSLLAVSEDVLYRQFCLLSSGEQTKVLLAALFLKENTFLLIDEPTNHLDLKGRQIMSRYLNRKKGFILISHDRNFLDQCVDHIMSINRADIEIQKGNFTTWQTNKERSDQFERRENDRLKSEIKALTEAAKRTAKWSDKVESSKPGALSSGVKADKGYIGHKAAKMMKRSKALEGRIEKNIEEKSGLLHNIERADNLAIHPLPYMKRRVIEGVDLEIAYEKNPIFQKINLKIEQGERIAILGKNGSGKSSLLKLLLGEEVPFSGQLYKGSGIAISYVPQDSSFLRGDLRTYALKEGIDETLFKAILRKLDFSRIQFEKDMAQFSAGQRKKVLIAKSLCQPAHLYIWDEPLNYIDVISRMQIENLILAHRPTMIFVEHDQSFIDKVATDVITLASNAN